MKAKLMGAIAIALLVVLVFAVVAQAGVSDATILAIIEDANDGTIDGDWTAAEIRAALAAVQNDPLFQQYSAVQGVLEDYLASLQAPGDEEGGTLAFTGSEVLLILGAGVSLIGSGALLRRRRD